MLPTIGRIVLYQTDARNGFVYSLPAMIVRTRASTDPMAVEAKKVAALPDDMTVDLFVFSVDGESYGESAVPYGEADRESSAVPSPHAGPRTWRWPPRV